MRSDNPAIRQQVASVVEHHDVVAEQAPALLGMGGHNASGLAVRRLRWGARRLMRTFHDRFPPVLSEVRYTYHNVPRRGWFTPARGWRPRDPAGLPLRRAQAGQVDAEEPAP